MNMLEFAQDTERPWGFIAIEVSDTVASLLTTQQIGKHLAQDFREEARKQGGEIVEGSFHQATQEDVENFQLDLPSGKLVFICLMVKE